MSEQTTDNPHHQDVRNEAQTTLLGDSHAQTQADVVHFTSYGDTTTTSMDQDPFLDQTYISIQPNEGTHAIEDFLNRDIYIGNFTWNSSASIGDFLHSVHVMDTLRNNENLAIFRQKLQGFYGTSLTASLRVVYNAYPQQAGMFHIYYIPYDEQPSSVVSTNVPWDSPNQLAIGARHYLTLPFTTGCPNVYCNASSQSECQIKSPYVGSVPFVNLTNPNAVIGRFEAQVVSPLLGPTNAESLNINVYLKFENIKTFGATSSTFKVKPQGLGEDLSGAVDSVSKVVGKGNVVGDFLDTVKPVLKQGAPLVTAASKLALMGLSKPTLSQSPQRAQLKPFDNMATVDTGSVAAKLSYSKEQGIRVAQLGVDQIDEMDLNHFIEKPTYYTQFALHVNDPVHREVTKGALLAEPNCVLSDGTTVQNARTYPSRFRFAANAFSQWRGTVRYHFKVLATQFHTARLRFVYLNGDEYDPNKNPSELPFLYTYYVDIRGPMEFSIDCPYIAATHWRNVPQYYDLLAQKYVSQPVGLQDRPNMLLAYVETPLHVLDTYSQEIRIAVFVSGCEDVEFAVPCAPRSIPALRRGTTNSNSHYAFLNDHANAADLETSEELNHRTCDSERSSSFNSVSTSADWTSVSSASQAEQTSESCGAERFRPQGVDDVVVHDMSGATIERRQDPHVVQLTTGEKIQNIRALIKRYFPMGRRFVSTEWTAILLPYEMTLPYTSPTESSLTYSYLDIFWHCYRFFRGGLRYQLTTNAEDYHFDVRYDPGNFWEPSSDVSPLTRFIANSPLYPPTREDVSDTAPHSAYVIPMATTQAFSGRLESGACFEVPYYTVFDRAVTISKDSIFAPPAQYSMGIESGYTPRGFIQIVGADRNSSEGGHLTISRAAADDFTFGFLLGAPATAVNRTMFDNYHVEQPTFFK